ncbi:MAG TPA: SPFH domain-containing protein, partial [Nitrospiria bacterium]|nr:SPFH domain-containing protein [Nitrospiria bacterium]
MPETLPIIVLIVLLIFLFSRIRILKEYERAVVFRLGRVTTAFIGGNGPGLIVLLPFVDQMEKVSLRTIAMDVPAQDIITRDNVSVKVNAVIYFRVIDPNRAILEVENYLFA